tara:strand:+ start:468 stop:1367 length:900 start_codon:yes stop_codon:yes gene_type:complete
MSVYSDFKPNDKLSSEPIVTSIGGFDGVHLGHKALFEKASNESHGKFQIVTFNQVPKIYFNNSLKPLLDQNQRTLIFEKLKPKNIIYLDFNSVNKMNALEFCDFLQNNLNTQKLVIGKDFKFGSQRVGDVNTLIDYFGETNVILLDDFLIDSEKVSTTKIRLFYSKGDVKNAEKYLGRKISFNGTVVKGRQLGATIGFPTANVNIIEEIQFPRFGVYAVNVFLNNKKHLGCMNIGLNPTVDTSTSIKVEIHILNFDEDIYGDEITFNLLEFIRDERKFESIDALKLQISKDIEQIKNNF